MILMSLGFRICHLESTRLMIKEGASPRVGVGEPQTRTAQSSVRDTGQLCGCFLWLYFGDSYNHFSRKETGLGTVD